MKRAAELLKTGRYSVSEVTYDVGSNDLKYLENVSRKNLVYLLQQYKEQNTDGFGFDISGVKILPF